MYEMTDNTALVAKNLPDLIRCLDEILELHSGRFNIANDDEAKNFYCDECAHQVPCVSFNLAMFHRTEPYGFMQLKTVYESLKEIDNLHYPENCYECDESDCNEGSCSICGDYYPCETVQIIDNYRNRFTSLYNVKEL